MTTIEPSIFYCESNHLYNYPFILRFSNETELSIDFYFHEEDYSDASMMLIARTRHIADELLQIILNYYIELQEICLIEPDIKAPNAAEITKRIEELLEMMYYLTTTLLKQYTIIESAITKGKTDEPLDRKRYAEFYEELLENFELLEDYYPLKEAYKLRSFKSLFLKLDKVNCVEPCCSHNH